jgi:phosphoglycolate phosphatase-like HAD superfamily hydrolase
MMSVRHFRLDDAFEVIECGSPEGIVKASAIRRVLAGWQMTPDRAAYVGDAGADMLAAREVGVVAAGAAWAHGTRVTDLKDAGADVIFTGAGEFVAWLDVATRDTDARGIAARRARA